MTATSQKALTTSETQPKVTEVLEQPTPTLVEPTPTNTSTPTTTPTSTPEPTPTLTPTLEPLVSPDLEADFLWNGETATIGLLSSEPYRYANGVVDAIFSGVITAIYSTEIESEGEEVTVWMADFFLGYSEQKEPIIKRFLLGRSGQMDQIVHFISSGNHIPDDMNTKGSSEIFSTGAFPEDIIPSSWFGHFLNDLQDSTLNLGFGLSETSFKPRNNH